MAYDLSSDAFLNDPTQMLSQMRAEGPVVRIKIPLLGDCWMTTTDQAARSLLKQPDLFGRNPMAGTGKTMAQKFWFLPRFMSPLFENMLAHDGPDHARLRGLVDQAFQKTKIDDMRAHIGAIADALLDQIDTTQPVEIIGVYTRALPLMVICELLGIPTDEREKVAGWIAPISGTASAWSILRGLPGLWRLMRYFKRDFARVRKTPRPGLITDLVQAEDAGDMLSDDELLAMVVTLFIAGHETTVHLISMGIHGALSRPATALALREAGPELPLLVEEFMRFYAPVMMTKPHYVRQDTVFEGVPLKKGDQIAALLVAANHDPARFEAPQDFIANRRPNPHLGFGHGPHVCLGMQLARAEAQVALARLFARFPDIRLADPDAAPAYTKRIGIHGLRRLDVRLT